MIFFLLFDRAGAIPPSKVVLYCCWNPDDDVDEASFIPAESDAGEAAVGEDDEFSSAPEVVEVGGCCAAGEVVEP